MLPSPVDDKKQLSAKLTTGDLNQQEENLIGQSQVADQPPKAAKEKKETAKRVAEQPAKEEDKTRKTQSKRAKPNKTEENEARPPPTTASASSSGTVTSSIAAENNRADFQKMHDAKKEELNQMSKQIEEAQTRFLLHQQMAKNQEEAYEATKNKNQDEARRLEETLEQSRLVDEVTASKLKCLMHLQKDLVDQTTTPPFLGEISPEHNCEQCHGAGNTDEGVCKACEGWGVKWDTPNHPDRSRNAKKATPTKGEKKATTKKK